MLEQFFCFFSWILKFDVSETEVGSYKHGGRESCLELQIPGLRLSLLLLSLCCMGVWCPSELVHCGSFLLVST